MNILFIHPSFPGQYLYLASYFGNNPEHNVVFLAKENSIEANIHGVRLALYKPPAEVPKETHVYLKSATEAILEGQQTIRALLSLRDKNGFKPDIIVGHAGWGSLLYIKDVYPDVPVIGFFEWYYHSLHSENYWWPDEIPDINSMMAIRTRDAHHLMSMEACDMGITPTNWQRQQFPERYQSWLKVQHEGIDTSLCSPAEGKKRPGLVLDGAKLNLPQGTEIITYVSRGFEAIRGFPQFMDAMRIVTKDRPKCHVVICGDDRVCYGNELGEGKTFLGVEKEKGYNEKQIHFVGHLNRGDYQKLLRSSSCHVYLTRPFILSWSMLESMSFGCPLVTSKTPPCEEVVTDGVNGMLAEFRSPQHIARKVEEVLSDRSLAKKLGAHARETILETYDLTKCLHKYEDLMYSLVK